MVREVVAHERLELGRRALLPEILEDGAVEVEDVARAAEAVLRGPGEERDLVVVAVARDRGADLRAVRRRLQAQRDQRVEDPVAGHGLRQVKSPSGTTSPTYALRSRW